MYYIYIDGELAFDAVSDSPCVASASLSQAINAPAYLDMELAAGGAPRDGAPVRVEWDGDVLFAGSVASSEQTMAGTWRVTAVSDLDRMNGVLVPPHSTDGSVGEECPSTLSGYVQWLAETFNRRSVGGYRIDVGVNRADLISRSSLDFSEEGWTTVAAALEDRVLSLGGYIDWRPGALSGTLDVWDDLHEASDQLVEVGENVTDMKVGRSLDGRRTAVVPSCGGVDLSDPSEEALALAANAGLMVANGALYDPEAVAEWGYSEQEEEVEGAESDADLVRLAVPALRTLTGPLVTVEARAVDMALYRQGVGHLRVGQAARVRAASFGVDEYLAVQDMDLDLMDPSQTVYTLGAAYDTLTGQQSKFLRELNAGISDAVDRVEGVTEEVGNLSGQLVAVEGKADEALDQAHQNAQDIGSLTEGMQSVEDGLSDLASEVAGIDADVEQAKADAADALASAQQTATDAAAGVQEAKDAAQAAKDAADEAKATADGYQQQITDVTATVNGVEQEVAGYTAQIEGAVEDAAGALSAATKAQQDLAGFKTEASQTYQPKGDYATSTDLQSYATKSEVEQTAGELSASVEEATETAEGALSQATQAKQTADSVKTSLETNYVSKTDASQTYASKAELSATSSSLSASIEEVATTADAAREKALEVEATASGLKTTITQVSTVANQAKSAADTASTAAGKAQSTADGAVKQVTSLSATVDGIEAEVEQTATTASDALSKATSAQQSIDGFKTTVSQTYLKKSDASSTYATKTALTQTEDSITAEVAKTYQSKADMASYATRSYVEQQDNSIKSTVSSNYTTLNNKFGSYYTKTEVDQKDSSIKSTVSSVQKTADSALTKASQVEQTADGIQVTLTEVETTANTAKTNASTALSTANSAKTTATNAQNTANAAKKQVYHSASGTSGTAGYVRFATVKFTGAYMNRPLFFALSNRGPEQSNVWVRWGNSGNADPSLASIKADGGINVWAHKTGTSTWEIIAQKSEGYDTIYINDFSNNNGSGCAVSWVNVQLSSVPSGSTAATRLAGKRASADIDNAAKTATNYLKFDSSGLCVGNMTGTLGYNTLIKSTGVDIRNGSKVLSSFGESQISLGNNSSSSQIKMCGNVGTILTKTVGSAQSITLRTSNANRYMYTGTNSSGIRADDLNAAALELWHQSANDLAIRMRARTIEVEGTTDNRYYANIELKYLASLLGNGNALHVPAHIRCGTKVVTVPKGSDSAAVWSLASFQNEMGFQFNASDTSVVFMNGDGSANGKHVEGSTYLNGNIYVVLNGVVSVNTQTRVNYIACKNEI